MITKTRTAVTKIKIKAGTITIMQKYQTMMSHIMILTSMMPIRRITNNIIISSRMIRITNPMLRNLKMITISGIMNPRLRNLKMIMIVIRMILINKKEMLLQEEETTTWVLKEVDEVLFPAYQTLLMKKDLTDQTALDADRFRHMSYGVSNGGSRTSRHSNDERILQD